MEEYININYQNIVEQIKRFDSPLQYAACAKFLDLVRPYFCKYIFPADNNLFYRVRAHTEGTGKYFFTNISELSYRSDFFDIKKFGRCNCPYESIFYCSNSAFLSLMEVSQLLRIETKKDALYYTLSIWKMNKSLNISPIFQNKESENYNKKLADLTNSCLETIDSFNDYSKKEQLKDLHNLIGREFVKPFSEERNIYFFSSAVANYLLKHESGKSENIDGIVYPTCVDMENINNTGLNYAFSPTIIGFENKIEFIGAYRSKMQMKGKAFFETERIKFRKANRFTGYIKW